MLLRIHHTTLNIDSRNFELFAEIHLRLGKVNYTFFLDKKLRSYSNGKTLEKINFKIIEFNQF